MFVNSDSFESFCDGGPLVEAIVGYYKPVGIYNESYFYERITGHLPLCYLVWIEGYWYFKDALGGGRTFMFAHSDCGLPPPVGWCVNSSGEMLHDVFVVDALPLTVFFLKQQECWHVRSLSMSLRTFRITLPDAITRVGWACIGVHGRAALARKPKQKFNIFLT